jgi:hypothetical protein
VAERRAFAMQPLRREIRELIRASEAVLSLESFGGTHLSAEERGVILLCADDLTKKFANPGNVKADVHDRKSTHDGKTLADW